VRFRSAQSLNPGPARWPKVALGSPAPHARRPPGRPPGSARQRRSIRRARLLRGRGTRNGPGEPPRKGTPPGRADGWLFRRLSAHAEQVERAERQLGHEVDRRVQQLGAGLAPVEVRERAHLHQRRHVRQPLTRARQAVDQVKLSLLQLHRLSRGQASGRQRETAASRARRWRSCRKSCVGPRSAWIVVCICGPPLDGCSLARRDDARAASDKPKPGAASAVGATGGAGRPERGCRGAARRVGRASAGTSATSAGRQPGARRPEPVAMIEKHYAGMIENWDGRQVAADVLIRTAREIGGRSMDVLADTRTL
jgi:hypothetical protein